MKTLFCILSCLLVFSCSETAIEHGGQYTEASISSNIACTELGSDIDALLTIDRFFSAMFDDEIDLVQTKLESMQEAELSTQIELLDYLYAEFGIHETVASDFLSLDSVVVNHLYSNFESIIDSHGENLISNDCLVSSYYYWGDGAALETRFPRCSFWDTAFTVVRATAYIVGEAAGAPATGGATFAAGGAGAALEVGSYTADCG